MQIFFLISALSEISFKDVVRTTVCQTCQLTASTFKLDRFSFCKHFIHWKEISKRLRLLILPQEEYFIDKFVEQKMVRQMNVACKITTSSFKRFKIDIECLCVKRLKCGGIFSEGSSHACLHEKSKLKDS